MNIDIILNRINYLDEHLLLKQIAIIIAYAVLAKIVDLFIEKILRRIVRKTTFTFDEHILDYLHRPVFWGVLCTGILHSLAIAALEPPYLTILPAIIKSFMLLLWLVAIVKISNFLFDYAGSPLKSKEKVGHDLRILTKKIVRVVIILAGINWLLVIWDVNLTPLFASAGIAGIAVAMAAKDSLANFFGGISLFMDRTFQVGDYVIIDNDKRGEVVEVGIRSTRIQTRDDVIVTIPNSILSTSVIINESAPIPRFRIKIPVGVAYGCDLDHVEKVLLKVAGNNNAVAREPEPRVRLRTFGASSIDFELLLWVNDPREKGLQTHNLLMTIYKTFAEEDIPIPFPQLDVHFDQQIEAEVRNEGVQSSLERN